MKTYCCVLILAFWIITGLNACKKCYTCSPPMATVPGYATGATVYCFKHGQESQMAEDDSLCLSVGGNWERGNGGL
jgi:hypothetical protein